MALNRSSKFGADEGLFPEKQDNNTQQVQEVNIIGSTQGKKGKKLKRINMAFSDVNHSFIIIESRRRGLSATAFVNGIIEEYRKLNNDHSTTIR